MNVLEQIQQMIEEGTLEEFHKNYYLDAVPKMKEKEQKALLELMLKMEEAGFKNSIAAAYSEIAEDIPQFARMTVLKELHRIVRNPEDNLSYAEDLAEDDDWDELLEKFRKTFSEAEAEKFLRLYTKGVMASVYDFFEDGNPRADEDDLTWVLLETKADGSHSERVIDGFWEDDFVDEDFDWEK